MMDWAALGGDLLVVAGLVVSYGIYRRQAFDGRKQRVDSTLALLRAVRNGIEPWGDQYFVGGYNDRTAADRARRDYVAILGRGYAQVYRVPGETLVELVQGSSEGSALIARRVTETANVALWRIAVFNQLVQQQTDFNAQNQADILDPSLPAPRREALARAAELISLFLHLRGIGDTGWYADLKSALDDNIERLEIEGRKLWWKKGALRWAVALNVESG